MSSKKFILRELRQIPGVGESIAEDLWGLGIRSIRDLKRKSPEKLYHTLCDGADARVDRYMLYVLRCAVYYASHRKHDADLLKWWNWKEAKRSKIKSGRM